MSGAAGYPVIKSSVGDLRRIRAKLAVGSENPARSFLHQVWFAMLYIPTTPLWQSNRKLLLQRDRQDDCSGD